MFWWQSSTDVHLFLLLSQPGLRGVGAPGGAAHLCDECLNRGVNTKHSLSSKIKRSTDDMKGEGDKLKNEEK